MIKNNNLSKNTGHGSGHLVQRFLDVILFVVGVSVVVVTVIWVLVVDLVVVGV